MQVIKNKKRFVMFLICITIGVLLGCFISGGYFWAIIFGFTTAFLMDAIAG